MTSEEVVEVARKRALLFLPTTLGLEGLNLALASIVFLHAASPLSWSSCCAHFAPPLRNHSPAALGSSRPLSAHNLIVNSMHLAAGT